MTGQQAELFPDPATSTDTRPTHVVRLGDTRTLCGTKLDTDDALPYIGEPYADRHNHNLCPDCDQQHRQGDRQ